MNAALWLLLFRSAVVTPPVAGPYWLDERDVYLPGVRAAQVYRGGVVASEAAIGGVVQSEVKT
jgi:hypothetical protein